MKKYDMIFLDRDGTINPDPGYIANLDDFQFYEFLFPALKLLSDYGQRFSIITNQSGVARGIIKQSQLDEINDFIIKSFARNKIPLYNIYVCTDHPDTATENRKPGTGMFRQAARDYDLQLQDCLMIGDSEKDIIAGQKLAMETMLVLTGEGEKTYTKIKTTAPPTYVVKNIVEGTKLLMDVKG
ncbi:MAG: HAD family hydrolase [Candidatus Marinimicrobia bacterium]|nr:HAD family hydrolase [Candidatus Neomarinimicrobiota bacterium]